MKARQHCIDFIKKFESFSSAPYECSGGKKTIGYGHVIQDGENLFAVSPALGNEILKKDVEWVEHALNKDFSSLSQNQFDALVSFVFNIGHGRFLNSSVYKFTSIYLLLFMKNCDMVTSCNSLFIYKPNDILLLFISFIAPFSKFIYLTILVSNVKILLILQTEECTI